MTRQDQPGTRNRPRRPNRRAFLGTVGVGITGTLSGCTLVTDHLDSLEGGSPTPAATANESDGLNPNRCLNPQLTVPIELKWFARPIVEGEDGRWSWVVDLVNPLQEHEVTVSNYTIRILDDGLNTINELSPTLSTYPVLGPGEGFAFERTVSLPNVDQPQIDVEAFASGFQQNRGVRLGKDLVLRNESWEDVRHEAQEATRRILRAELVNTGDRTVYGLHYQVVYRDADGQLVWVTNDHRFVRTFLRAGESLELADDLIRADDGSINEAPEAATYDARVWGTYRATSSEAVSNRRYGDSDPYLVEHPIVHWEETHTPYDPYQDEKHAWAGLVKNRRADPIGDMQMAVVFRGVGAELDRTLETRQLRAWTPPGELVPVTLETTDYTACVFDRAWDARVDASVALEPSPDTTGQLSVTFEADGTATGPAATRGVVSRGGPESGVALDVTVWAVWIRPFELRTVRPEPAALAPQSQARFAFDPHVDDDGSTVVVPRNPNPVLNPNEPSDRPAVAVWATISDSA